MFEIFPTGDSLVYRMVILERQEIEKLKWIESEKAGKDIGYHHAFWIWNMQHRKNWIKKLKDENQNPS